MEPRQYSYTRRPTARGPRWSLLDPDAHPVAYCNNHTLANKLASELNEVRELRVLVMVTSRQLTISAACQMLGCNKTDLQNKIMACLAKGF